MIALALVVLILSFSRGLACYAPVLETHLYEPEDLETGIDGPAIVEVTILGISMSTDGKFMVGTSRVEKVIKGAIESNRIEVLGYPTTCDPGFHVGMRGIVVGSLQHDRNGALQIVAIREKPEDRYQRRHSARDRTR
jgi:hypothetical protein